MSEINKVYNHSNSGLRSESSRIRMAASKRGFKKIQINKGE